MNKSNDILSPARRYIDLHAHLDGSITPDIARRLAALQGIALPADDEKELAKLLTVPADCTSLNDFLRCLDLPVSLMQSYEGLREGAYLVAERMKAEGIVYGELRYAPQLHMEGGMTQEDAVRAVLEGIGKSDMKVNVILCCMRGRGLEEKNRETVELAKKYLVADGGVVALDLAGAEALYPTADFRELFEKAKQYGIPFTIHAGEAAGSENVRQAIEFGAVRIGHGVRINEDDSVMALVRDRGVFLEMCPTSNRQTLAVKDMAEYPFMDYLRCGIRVTLNSDDPAVEGTTIGNEYRYMEESFGLTPQQERLLLSNAVDAAFTTAAVKAGLRQTLGLD